MLYVNIALRLDEVFSGVWCLKGGVSLFLWQYFEKQWHYKFMLRLLSLHQGSEKKPKLLLLLLPTHVILSHRKGNTVMFVVVVTWGVTAFPFFRKHLYYLCSVQVLLRAEWIPELLLWDQQEIIWTISCYQRFVSSVCGILLSAEDLYLESFSRF